MFLFYLGKTHTLRAWWVGLLSIQHRRYRCAQHLPTIKGNPRWGLRVVGGVIIATTQALSLTLNTYLQNRKTRDAGLIILQYRGTKLSVLFLST